MFSSHLIQNALWNWQSDYPVNEADDISKHAARSVKWFSVITFKNEISFEEKVKYYNK